MSINIDYFALKKDVKVPSSFVIAPQDAINKSGADLILTGDPEADRAAIQQAIHDLHNARESTDIAIRIDFLGGTIDVGTKTDGNAIVIPVGYDNIHLYGNGVKLTGEVYDPDYVEIYSVFTNNADNVIIDGFNIVNNASDYGSGGLSNSGSNCTITGNTCSGIEDGLFNSGSNCTITGNICSSSEYYGLYNDGSNCTITGNTCSASEDGLFNSGSNCTITGNTCSSDYGHCLYNSGSNCTITGNTCSIVGGDGLSNYGTNCIITCNTCNATGYGLSNSGTNCTIIGNTCSSHCEGLYNSGSNCTITGNICSSSEYYGLYNKGTNCTITGNTCSSSGDDGLYNASTSTTDKCIIIGNICLDGGISVLTDTCLPATRAAMEDVNTGTVTIRS